jgi:hypothetical protein
LTFDLDPITVILTQTDLFLTINKKEYIPKYCENVLLGKEKHKVREILILMWKYN